MNTSSTISKTDELTDKQTSQHDAKKVFSFISNFAEKFMSDARHYQIAFLSVFLFFGITSLGWDVDAKKFIVTFATCFLTQFLFIVITKGNFNSLKSSLISSFSLCLMFKANMLETVALASFLSIASKFILKINGKHIFNPTNFGIIVTILFTHDAWVSPGQWGSNGLLIFSVGLLGLVVLLKVKRLDTALAFFITFAGLMFYRSVLYLHWPMNFYFHQLSSGTLLLFTFFMITDPVSTPSNKYARIIWASAVGVLAYYLQVKLFMNATPVWALFFLSPLSPLLDHFFKGEKFQWLKKSKSSAFAEAMADKKNLIPSTSK